MTYRLRRAPPHYIEDDWSEQQQKQQQQQISDNATINRRKYIDPWDLENFEYIQRTIIPSSLPEMHIMTPSPAGEPIASTFYYVSSGADDAHYGPQQHQHQRHQFVTGHEEEDLIDMDMMLMDGGGGNGGGSAERFDYTTGCYAGLDEELFYNAKYESIHDEPYGMNYTDIETASSNERTSSCGSSSAVSTLQLHTPGFGVRASGRRSIVLPKPEPHIEFPPPPSPPQKFYAGVEADNIDRQQRLLQSPPSTLLRRSHAIQSAVDAVSAGGTPIMKDSDHHHQHLHSSDDDHLPVCSLSNCYECIPENVPVYAISPGPATIMRRRISGVMDFGGGIAPDGLMMGVTVPPNNFGLSKRGLLQIDYSFNWNNLYRFISNGY